MATGPVATVPEPYPAYAQVFSEADSEPLPCHGPQDLAIELLDGRQQAWRLIDNVFEKDLETLRPYPKV